MKKIFISIGIMLLFFNAVAQKKHIKKKTNARAAAVSVVAGIDDNYNNDFKIDTLRIASGKPYVFLVDIRKEYDDGMQIIGGSVENEEKELLKNFDKNSFQIIKLYKHVFVLFENGQTLDSSVIENSYQAFAFWGGKLADDVQVKEGTTMSTEFVAEQMSIKKESSYIVNTSKYKKMLDLLDKNKSFTEKSKQVMNNFLDGLYTSLIGNSIGQDAIFFSVKPLNLKTLNLYVSAGSKKKILRMKIEFGQNGLLNKIISFDENGKKENTKSFVYENEILKKMVNDNLKTTTFSYADDKMISFTNVGDADQTDVYSLDNGKESYVLTKDDAYSNLNIFTKLKFEKNCEIVDINDVVWTRTCFTAKNIFPYINTYTSYQDGKVLQYKKFKIEKKDDKIYEKYYSKAEKANEKDVFVKKGTFELNDEKLLTRYSYLYDNENVNVDIEYLINK